MASEDFGRYAEYVPANFTFMGNGSTGQAGGIPLHSKMVPRALILTALL